MHSAADHDSEIRAYRDGRIWHAYSEARELQAGDEPGRLFRLTLRSGRTKAAAVDAARAAFQDLAAVVYEGDNAPLEQRR